MCNTGVKVDADVQLLGLCGKVFGQQQQFLLDSGASCNFVSQELLSKLNVDWDLCVSSPVQLADKTVLKTCGKVDLKVSFGPYSYFGTFYVLQAKVPLILGMTFFQHAQPIVDWQQRSVQVAVNGKKLSLPVVPFSNQSMHVLVNSWPGRTQQCNTFDVDRRADVAADVAADVDTVGVDSNMFAGLQVDLDVDDEAKVEQLLPTPAVSNLVVAPTSLGDADVDLPRVKKRAKAVFKCPGCSKVL